MADIKDLLDIASQPTKVIYSSELDRWLVACGYDGNRGPLVRYPACLLLYKWAKAHPEENTYYFINKRIFFKQSEILSSYQKVRLNVKPFNPMGWLIPEYLFGKPSRKDIIEAAAWYQNEKAKAKTKRIRVLSKKTSQKLNKNITTSTTSTN